MLHRRLLYITYIYFLIKKDMIYHSPNFRAFERHKTNHSYQTQILSEFLNEFSRLLIIKAVFLQNPQI